MYLDICLCKHKASPKYFLFRAPAFSYLQKGELVIVETRNGEQEAEIVNSITLDSESKELAFIMKWLKCSCKSHELKRVLKRVAYRDLIYKDEENDDIVEITIKEGCDGNNL